MSSSVNSVIVKKSDILDGYQIVKQILDLTVDEAWGELEERENQNSTSFLDLFVDEVFNKVIDIKRVESDEPLDENDTILSVDEEDIEKKIKDLRRISENETIWGDVVKTELDLREALVSTEADEEDIMVETDVELATNTDIIEDMSVGVNIVERVVNSVDFEDRHWKRKRLGNQKRRLDSYKDNFKQIHESPVRKFARCDESIILSFPGTSLAFDDHSLLSRNESVRMSSPLLSSTPTLPSSIPWSVTEAAPPIFWSKRGQQKTEESNGGKLMPLEGRTGVSEEGISFSENPEKIEEHLDLREILRRKKHKLKLPNSGSKEIQTIAGIDRIKVTVDEDLVTRKVFDKKIDLEDGELLDSSASVKSLNVNSKYDRSLLSDLLRKKKVLEHLIDMASREADEDIDEVSEENLNSETSFSSAECEFVPRVPLDTFTESRCVVYRSSSPCSPSAEIPPRNVYSDFTAELAKGMKDIFPSKSKLPVPESVIKVEPISDDDVTLSDAETIVSAREQVESDTELENKPPSKSSYSESSYVYKVKDNRKFDCSLCNVIVVSERSMKEHMKGKKHQRNLDDIKKHKIPTCLGAKNTVEHAKKKIVKQGGGSGSCDLGRNLVCVDEKPREWNNNIVKAEMENYLPGKNNKVDNVRKSDNVIDESSEIKKPNKRQRIIWDLK